MAKVNGMRITVLKRTETAKVTGIVRRFQHQSEFTIPTQVEENGITFPVTEIDDAAFRNCSALTSITIPKGIERIGKLAFAECSSLTSITIPKTVKQIESGRVDIGENVYYGHLFTNCQSLTSIVVDKCNPRYKTIQNGNGIIDTKTNTLIAGDQTTSIPKNVINIGEYAFAECKALTSVTIPDSVTSIGRGAFMSCDSLTSITIPNSVTSIGQSAFRNCKQLNSTITIPKSVKYIGYWAFANCKQLENVTIGHNFIGIGDVFDGDGRPSQNGQNLGRPLKETERKKRNKPIIKAIELFLNALDSFGNKKPHDYEYLLGQTIRQYEPAENHQHVSIGAWEYWKIDAFKDEDIRQFQYTWLFQKKQKDQFEKFNTHFIQEHTTPVADIKKALKDLVKNNNNNICFQSIEDILEKMHISRILKDEDEKIKKNSGRGLEFEEIANDCYQGAGIEFQCSEHKIGYEAFKGCDKLKKLEIGGKKICRTKVKNLKKGERITIP